jgi:hypothetical protein
MKLQITIPDYLMVKHYKMLTHLSSLDEVEQMVAVITALTGYESREVMKWNIPAVIQVYNELNTVLKNIQPEFYPIIEWKDKQYGFSSMSKMSLGEYIDLDTLCKDTENNLNQILAMLYRPITKNNVAGKYMVKSTLKAMKYEVENIFDYYEIEEYDPFKRKRAAKEFDDFPAEIALGALGFFLSIAAMSSKNSATYFQEPITEILKMKNKMMMSKMKQLSQTITAGYLHSKTLATPPSYPSQEIKPLQT